MDGTVRSKSVEKVSDAMTAIRSRPIICDPQRICAILSFSNCSEYSKDSRSSGAQLTWYSLSRILIFKEILDIITLHSMLEDD